jgi:hypothetical protein
MSERPDIDFNGFGAWAIIVMFFMFWAQSGWYRLDCAMGVQRACELIGEEYKKEPKP